MTTKIAVSLPDELVDEARQAVRDGRAESVSGYVAEAMSQRSRRESLAVLLDDLDEELGAPGRGARRWAEQQLRRTRA